MICGKEMRDGPCRMDKDHRGRHSTVTFYCDMCGKMRRGQPYRTVQQLQSDGYYEAVADYCFMCDRQIERKWWERFQR